MKHMNDFSIREAVESDENAIWRLKSTEMEYQFPLDATIGTFVYQTKVVSFQRNESGDL